jgi:NADH-quinone oxidoreductase subunit H
MFFLGEYSNMLLMAALISVLFFGGWLPFFSFLSFIPDPVSFALKIVIFCFLFVLVRATFPRYRYDQLMDIGWKVFLPITLAYFFLSAAILYYFEALPFHREVLRIYEF